MTTWSHTSDISDISNPTWVNTSDISDVSNPTWSHTSGISDISNPTWIHTTDISDLPMLDWIISYGDKEKWSQMASAYWVNLLGHTWENWYSG